MESIRIWRISHRDHSSKAWTGEGARLYGGRFNSQGQPVVYASESLSLALLEILVQANDRSYLSVCRPLYADVPRNLILEQDPAELAQGWNAIPYGVVSQRYGDRWLADQSSAVIKLPSVVVPSESNYLINPLHRDTRHIRYSEPERVSVDPRLLQDEQG